MFQLAFEEAHYRNVRLPGLKIHQEGNVAWARCRFQAEITLKPGGEKFRFTSQGLSCSDEKKAIGRSPAEHFSPIQGVERDSPFGGFRQAHTRCPKRHADEWFTSLSHAQSDLMLNGNLRLGCSGCRKVRRLDQFGSQGFSGVRPGLSPFLRRSLPYIPLTTLYRQDRQSRIRQKNQGRTYTRVTSEYVKEVWRNFC